MSVEGLVSSSLQSKKQWWPLAECATHFTGLEMPSDVVLVSNIVATGDAPPFTR